MYMYSIVIMNMSCVLSIINGVLQLPVGSVSDRYAYMQDLIAFEACRPEVKVAPLPQCLQQVSTPLIQAAWEEALASHPDQRFSSYILTGIAEGFRIGFNRQFPLKSVSRNMPSAKEQHLALKGYVDKERAAGHLLGPVPRASTHVSRMGVIPKGHTPGRWRVITDLSHPPGASVNDGIDTDLCSLKYVSVDMVAEIVDALGRGSLMAKVDIEAAESLIRMRC